MMRYLEGVILKKKGKGQQETNFPAGGGGRLEFLKRYSNLCKVIKEGQRVRGGR